MNDGKLYISSIDMDRGGNTVHVYEHGKKATGAREKYDGSLCGMSLAKRTVARSLEANRESINCATCMEIMRKRLNGDST